jgi:hypothetical protein
MRRGPERRPKENHGLSRIPEYHVWDNIKSRCYDPANKCYSNYGARGIRVCPAWIDSFATFFSDMGSRPSPKHSIERIDNDGDYEPQNCRWATSREQARNRTTNRFITHNGETRCLADWAEFAGIKIGTLWFRIAVAQWPMEKALNPKDGRSLRWL